MAEGSTHEVATFYAHFDVLKEGEAPPPPLTVRVCDSIACEMAGARDLIAALRDGLGDGVRVLAAPLHGAMRPGADGGGRPSARRPRHGGSRLPRRSRAGDGHPVVPDYPGLDAYRAAGGYRILEACHAGERTREGGDRGHGPVGPCAGLGGAGFVTGQKWRLVAHEAGAPGLMAIKRRRGGGSRAPSRTASTWRGDPHRFLEGMLIAAWAVEAEAIWIYLRDGVPGDTGRSCSRRSPR